MVAGIIGAGESPENVCIREAEEEAGLALGALEPLGTHYMTPGGSSESVALYAGRCDAAAAGGVHGLDAEGEDIRVFTVPAGEAVAMVHDNRIRNAMTGMALLLFAARRKALRQVWR